MKPHEIIRKMLRGLSHPEESDCCHEGKRFNNFDPTSNMWDECPIHGDNAVLGVLNKDKDEGSKQ